jgi:hypothetical protein
MRMALVRKHQPGGGNYCPANGSIIRNGLRHKSLPRAPRRLSKCYCAFSFASKHSASHAYYGDTIILTARGDLDDQSLFAKILLQNGIDIERDVHVYRSGNFGGSVTANKIRVLSSFVDWRVYTQYRIFEDDKGNLEAFKEYFEPLPVHYEGYLIHPNGAITLYR